jgi:hypothetical protein
VIDLKRGNLEASGYGPTEMNVEWLDFRLVTYGNLQLFFDEIFALIGLLMDCGFEWR